MQINNFIEVNTLCYENEKKDSIVQNLIKEELLFIDAGEFTETITRTPGDEIAHVAGICFMQKIIESPDQILSANFYSNNKSNIVIIKLSKERYIKKKVTSSLNLDSKLSVDDAKKCVMKLRNSQRLHNKTGSAHASMLFDYELNSIAFAEDVGRHNAFDKVIGKIFMNKNLNKVFIGALSCRINYEMIKKVIRSKIPIIIGYGKPTSKAFDTALSYNITIAWMGRRGGFFIFTCKDRFY